MQPISNCHSIHGCGCSRRAFFAAAGGGAVGAALFAQSKAVAAVSEGKSIKPCGPASKYTPTVKGAFVRRKEDYGMWWPGAVYDGEAARKKYTQQIRETETTNGIQIDLRPEPIYSAVEADQWVAEAKAANPDGLFVLALDRQAHSWPTVYKAVDTGLPTVVFAPIGAAFTTNTHKGADEPRAWICSTDDFGQAVQGLKMIAANAKLRETRYVVIRGKQRRDTEVKHYGTKLRHIPEKSFLEEYNRTPVTEEIRAIAADYVKNAVEMPAPTRAAKPTEQDVINGVKSYVVARGILEREEGDAITMNCLGALGRTKVSLPCIAWSRMLDHGIPAACEADIHAAIGHALVQYLFGRPGFQQDPVPETAIGGLIGAHCTCPTRLNGFAEPPEPYYLSHHHGMRDAVPRPMWRKGQRMTTIDCGLSNQDDVPPRMIISTGEVVENILVPPAGGCVVSVLCKLDGDVDYLAYPGFHQIFFYGDFKKELLAYCRMFGIEPVVV